jgi:hypothetical protein
MKLKLKLEELAVDSFDTTAAEKAKGTVFGEQCTCYTNCTCPGGPTCDASCNGTCGGSCNGTCDGSCAGTCDASCEYTCYGCVPETVGETCQAMSCRLWCTGYSECYICQ